MEHSRNPTRGADRVLRFAPTAPTRHFPEEAAKHAGQSALDLIHQVAIVITSNEARAEAIVQRAIDELKAAEERIKGLEARALSAEARANEAEQWLVRLHDPLQRLAGVSHPQSVEARGSANAEPALLRVGAR
jgi:hypothetical protein